MMIEEYIIADKNTFSDSEPQTSSSVTNSLIDLLGYYYLVIDEEPIASKSNSEDIQVKKT